MVPPQNTQIQSTEDQNTLSPKYTFSHNTQGQNTQDCNNDTN